MAADLKTTLSLNDKNFNAKLSSACKKAQNQLQSVSQASGLLGKSIGGTAGLISGLIGGFSKMAGPMAAATASIAAIGAGLKSVVENSAKFEVALDHLLSLTGLSADLMESVKGQILNTANAIHVGASELADAYGIIGSKMPELLQSPKALDDIARAASTLGKAGLMDMTTAIESLTGIMNQMGAQASEAENYINVLAAGSKNGAGNIQYLSEAFTKAGGAISTAGLSVEQGTAVIETLAKKIPDAAIAGTRLNKVLLTLATSSNNELNPKVVGLEKALDNLKKMSGNTTEMVKMFGTANYSAAMILAEEADQVKYLTDAVSGTNEAEKQADINTQNLSGRVAALKASWENLTSAFSESVGVLSTVVDWLDLAVQGWLLLIAARDAYMDTKNTLPNTSNEQIEFYKGKGYNQTEAIKKTLNETKQLYEQEKKDLDDLLSRRDGLARAGIDTSKMDNKIALQKKMVEDYASEVERLDNIVNPKKKPTTPTGPTPPKPTKTGRGGSKNNEIPTHAGSLQALENEYKTFKERYLKGDLDISTDEAIEKIQDFEKRIKEKKIELKLEPDPESIPGMMNQLRELELNQLNPKLALPRDQFLAEKKKLEDEISTEKMKWGVELYVAPDSMQKLQEEYRKFLDDVAAGRFEGTAEEAKKKDKEFQQKIQSKSIENGSTVLDDLEEDLKKFKEDLTKKSSFEIAIGIELPKTDTALLDYIQALMDAGDRLIDKLKEQQKAYEKLGDKGKEAYERVTTEIAQTEAQQVEYGQKAKVLNEQILKTKKLSEGFADAGEAVGSLGTAFSSLGSSFDSPELNIAGTVAQAIANIALGASKAIAEGASWGPIGWIGFGFSIMAQLAAMVAQLHSITGFASGGIVGGGKPVGDKNLVRVNSGELILNKPQQARLWRMINGSESLNISPTGGQVEFKIRGSDLYGSLKNYKTLSKKQ